MHNLEHTLNMIFDNFRIDPRIDLNKEYEIKPYGEGHINDTYLVMSEPRYIMHRINTRVFKSPDRLMDNICSVTEYLKARIEERGGDPDKETLTVIKTCDGKSYYEYNGDCYRLYKFIDGVLYNSAENPMMFYKAAGAFGKFQNILSDYPADTLFEVIPDFHNTVSRFSALKKAIDDDIAGRAGGIKDEVSFALSMEPETGVIVDCIAKGEIPLRVTHNDTKLNNVLFDVKSGECICVIDLDTIMPGSLLYDYGDALRFGGATAAEDETDLSKVGFDLELFASFTKGFLEELGDRITDREIELLPFSAALMTYECGIRFLTDYLSGDTYFKIKYERHNLDRARNQFKLVRKIVAQYKTMDRIVEDIVRQVKIKG